MLEKNVKKVGGLFNDKKRNEIADPSWISIILANLVLRLILRPLPENIGYLIKTLGLMCLYYFLVQRRLGLKIKSTKKIRWSETLGVCWFLLLADFFYVSAVALGISKAPHMIGTALVIALGAGFFEEYFFRGLFLKLAFQDGIRSSKQVLGVVLLSALSFGLAHLGNLTHQPLNATLFQVYYATAIGIFFAAIYLRTGSLWWTIILHCLVDFASVLLSQSTQAAPATSIWNFIFWLPLIALGLFLIRPKKLKAIRYLND